MKRYVVEIEEKITYKVEFSADSQEYAERRVREIYDSGGECKLNCVKLQ